MDTFIGSIILFSVYFLPTIIAWARKNHAMSIFLTNLFFGWTVIGWVVALVMAFWSNNRKTAPTG